MVRRKRGCEGLQLVKRVKRVKWLVAVVATGLLCLGLGLGLPQADAAQVDNHLYNTLGIPVDASVKQVRKAYGKLTRLRHPSQRSNDVSTAAATNDFSDIQLAFYTLKDDELRYIYDTFGLTAVQQHQWAYPQDKYEAYQYYQDDFLQYDDAKNIKVIEGGLLDTFEDGEAWAIGVVSTASACPRCKELLPTLQTVAAELTGIINVGVYDCFTNVPFCEMLAIDRYPTILRLGKGSSHNRSMHVKTDTDVADVMRFVLQDIPMPATLDSSNFWQHILNSPTPYAVLVKFPTLAGAQTRFESQKIMELSSHLATIGQIDCEVETEICTQHKFSEPSLWFFGSKAGDREKQGKMSYIANKTVVKHSAADLVDTVTYSFSAKSVHTALLRELPMPPVTTAWTLTGDVVHEPQNDALLVFLLGNKADPKSKAVEKLAREMHHGRASWTEGGQIGIGHFRCIDDNKPLCENSLELPAAHVPEIRLYKMDGYETYYGQRTAWSIARFVQQSFRTKVTNLQSNKLPDKIKKGEKWVIYMLNHRCSYCRGTVPMFREASVFKPFAEDVRGPARETAHSLIMRGGENIRYGLLDCGKNKQLCDRLQVDTVPAIIYYDLKLDSGGKDNLPPDRYLGSLRNPREIAAFSLHSARPDAIHLDDVALKNHLSKTHSGWMFMFTAGSWCGPCTQVHPLFLEAGQRLHGVVKTGFLDCDVHTAFCNQMGVTAYPLIRFFGPHKPELQAEFPNEMWQHRQVSDYDHEKSGEYTARSIANWITSKLPDRVTKLSVHSHKSKVLDDTTTNWLVLYTSSSYCEPCAQYTDVHRRVAHLLRYEPLKVGTLDCSKHTAPCQTLNVQDYPTVLLYVRRGDEGTQLFNIPALSVAPTVSWVRNYLPRMDDDKQIKRVAEILHYFYERYDPACKSPYELEAISSKYLGKEDKLYESLEEKYGENPMVVYNSIQDYGLEYAYQGPSIATEIFNMVYGLHDPSSTGELVFNSVLVILIVMALIELPFPRLTTFLPTKKERTILLVGSHGTVGAGISAAFRELGWKVVGVDPVFKGLAAYSGDDDDIAATIEAVPDHWLHCTLKTCSVVVYCAEIGRAARYQTVKGLDASNNQRFRVFCERCRVLLGSHAPLSIMYVGGSWQKREVIDRTSMVINDDSYNKPKPSSHYEAAKIEAESNAKLLSEELNISMWFFDWINVVPNVDPEFIVAKMTRESMGKRSLAYPAGECGIPLLHTQDAGNLLVSFCEQHALANGSGRVGDGSRFQTVLVPGNFTPFSTLADVVKNTLFELELESDNDPQQVQPINMTERHEAENALRTRCESQVAQDLGFEADDNAIREGLRTSCIAAWNAELLHQRVNSGDLSISAPK